MTTRPPAEPGMSLEDVDTPALLIELDAFERNLQAMADAVAGSQVQLRPHAKTHKCAVIALRQMALGAVGACAQKVSEAEALVQAGVPDVLITNEVVGQRKLLRVAALARAARIGICVDDAGNLLDVAAAAAALDVRLDVMVEVDVGAQRCGVPPGAPALELAQRVDQLPHLRFRGLQAYQGRAQHLRNFDERRYAIHRAVGAVKTTADLLHEHGLACEVVSGAGTGSYRFELASGAYNELQVGSYIFMDADYADNLGDDGLAIEEFAQSLFVYSTVMSTPAPDRIVLDAGLKALSVDSGLPRVHDLSGATYVGASDEHGKVSLDPGTARPALGEKLKLVPGHCDPTVNLYDWYVCVRDGRVEGLWPIVARGAIT